VNASRHAAARRRQHGGGQCRCDYAHDLRRDTKIAARYYTAAVYYDSPSLLRHAERCRLRAAALMTLSIILFML